MLAAILILLSGAASASATSPAAVASVSIQGFQFVPASRTINVGDSVTWTNFDQAVHSAKANNGSFDTGFITNEQSKTITFNTAGTFSYICGVHGASMSGTIVVQALATPPPTPQPTPPPTPQPTRQPTPPPTPQPTPPPTPLPTPQRTAPPTPEPTQAATATPSPAVTTAAPTTTVTPIVAAVTPSASSVTAAQPSTSSVTAAQPSADRASAPAASAGDPGPGLLLIAGAVVVIGGLAGAALVLSRR